MSEIKVKCIELEVPCGRSEDNMAMDAVEFCAKERADVIYYFNDRLHKIAYEDLVDCCIEHENRKES